jgi:endo-beta-N-acetylglucosaminidase D
MRHIMEQLEWNSITIVVFYGLKTIKSDGTITQHDFVQNGYSLASIPAGAYDITDVVTNGNKIYVLRNEIYDDNGTSRYKIRVFAYDAFSNGGYNPDPNFGTGSAIFISEAGSDLLEAKGTMLGDS